MGLTHQLIIAAALFIAAPESRTDADGRWERNGAAWILVEPSAAYAERQAAMTADALKIEQSRLVAEEVRRQQEAAAIQALKDRGELPNDYQP